MRMRIKVVGESRRRNPESSTLKDKKVSVELASLGLVLLEFKEVKPAKKLDRNKDLLPLLEMLSGILKDKKVSVEPAILEEISMEHQAISDLLESGDPCEVEQRQRSLAQKVMGIVLSQVMTLDAGQEKQEILSALSGEDPPGQPSSS